jgi:hypothetical protein
MRASFLREAGLKMESIHSSLPMPKPKVKPTMRRKTFRGRFGSGIFLILALFFSTIPGSEGQQPQLKRPNEVPEEKPPEVKKPKKGKDPRAVGVLQLSGKNKATLIPIAILIDGKFYDASVYKADPIPMALEGGTVYEAEQAGVSQGLFTVGGALHSRNPGGANPWMATGSYVANGTEAPKTKRRAEDVPVGMDNSGDAPPRLTRGSGGTMQGTPSSTPTASSSPAGGESSEKAGRPDASGPAGGPSSASNSSGKGEEKSAAASGSAKTASSDGAGGEQAENYYRPTLRRGKPTEVAPDESKEAPTTGKAQTAEVKGASQEPVQLMAAISDADGPDPRPYTFFWKPGEEDERRQQMLKLAGNEVLAYLKAQAKNAIAVKPTAAKAGTSGRKAAAKVVQPEFENVHFRALDVWANNQPVMVLSAEAHLPASTAGPMGATESYSITVVARTDIYGSLRRLYAGVTDKFHLDVTPKLELIDAVDADGDGRGELLFREATDAGSGYLIYRATADNLWKMFDSLGKE